MTRLIKTRLCEHGRVVQRSGAFATDDCAVSLHTCFGPPDQDKERPNQDYALAWYPRLDDQSDLRFVVAIADGVTSAYRAEWASQVACWAASWAVVESVKCNPERAARDIAHEAFDRAGHAIGMVADDFTVDPQASCPKGQWVSTWNYVLRKGSYLQTTLLIACADIESMWIAGVGDSGAAWRTSDNAGSGQTMETVLAQCDLTTDKVNALGPLSRSKHSFDVWVETPLPREFLLAIHTDGIGRGLGISPLSILEELDTLQARRRATKEARRYVDRVIRARPQDFQDNLSLAVIRRQV